MNNVGNPSEDSLEALEALEAKSKEHPQDYDTLISLSQLYYALERYSDAVETTRKAERFDPLTADFQNIQLAMQSRDYVRAKGVAMQMLVRRQNHPRAVFTLQHLHRMRGEHEDSLAILKKALIALPADVSLRQALIRTYEDCGFFEEAVKEARHLVEIKKDFSTYWAFMNVSLRYGFYRDVIRASEIALALVRGDAAKQSEVNLLAGHAARILGQDKTAIECYRESLKLNSHNCAAWWALADLKTFQFSEQDKVVIKQLTKVKNLPVLQKCQAFFALAKSYEMSGQSEAAMRQYKQANALHPASEFNISGFEQAIDRIIAAFSSEVMSRQSGLKDFAVTPIFIVGLPRSGSTLVEQILASHSHIEGTLELLALPAVKREAHRVCVQAFGGHYLDKIGELSNRELEALGKSYLDKAELFRNEKTPYFIDKLPHNFEHVGLIHKILPHAIIIDTRRNPIDCGYSLFKQYFSVGSGFSYNQKAIGAYYNGYLALMDHWDSVAPSKVKHVQYEILVQDTEKAIRDLLHHIGISFELDCLEFYKNKRAVRTASSEQVRQPIYNKSVGAWRAVEDHLTDLSDALGEKTLERFVDCLGG